MQNNNTIAITSPPYAESIQPSKKEKDIPLLIEKMKRQEKKQVAEGRLSFFKRVHLSKGGIAAEWEDIIIGVRNQNKDGEWR